MFARIVVDIPAKATDRLFDYEIPASWASWVEVGSRVVVPFGPRKVLGFVVELTDEPELARNRIKPIVEVMDTSPLLTDELIQLSEWMRRKYLCNRIAALQSMLPTALKAKYKRVLIAGDHDSELDPIVGFVEQLDGATRERVLEQFPGKEGHIKHLLSSGQLKEIHQVKSQGNKKKRLTVFPPSSSELERIILQVPAQAKRQKEILLFFQEHSNPIAMVELTKQLGTTPATIKAMAEKKWLRVEAVEQTRDPYADRNFLQTESLSLTPQQSSVFKQVHKALGEHRSSVFLLHGVTGSGKTEVYLQWIEEVIQQGKESIVLVPEISLTPQMVERFKGRFGDLVAVMHSRLSMGERYDEWRKIKEKRAKVAIGARSAVFAPFTSIGLFIIDEEHETSYKQEDQPKYYAHEIAAARARYHNAVVVLGSATPSMESYFAEPQSVQRLQMKDRVAGRPLPEVAVVDMREELKEGNRSMFSRTLAKAIEERLERKEQIVLLLNRRGHSTFVMCRSCGYTAGCPHCEITLTYHRRSNVMRCHYCGYGSQVLTTCPDCESEHIRYFGTGTQKVEESLYQYFPGIRVIRMDVDTTTEKGSHEKWLQMFGERKADVLLGTQMVAKGLDFPDVTLVGVIAADTVLHLPDFRAAEKTFQLLTQVAGRAGRHERTGEVVIQTYNPEHYSIVHAAQHDYVSFAHKEAELRKQMKYPPFYELILITFTHEEISRIVRTGEFVSQRIRELWQKEPRNRQHTDTYMDVLGPVASPIPKKKDRYRFQCMIKYRKAPHITAVVRQVVEEAEAASGKDPVLISVDIHPQSMM